MAGWDPGTPLTPTLHPGARGEHRTKAPLLHHRTVTLYRHAGTVLQTPSAVPSAPRAWHASPTPAVQDGGLGGPTGTLQWASGAKAAPCTLPWVTTFTEPFQRMYQEVPLSPWLNTAGEDKSHRAESRIPGTGWELRGSSSALPTPGPSHPAQPLLHTLSCPGSSQPCKGHVALRYSRTVPARACDSNSTTDASSRFTCRERGLSAPARVRARLGGIGWEKGDPRQEQADPPRAWGGGGTVIVWGLPGWRGSRAGWGEASTHRAGQISHSLDVQQLLKYQLQLILRALCRAGERTGERVTCWSSQGHAKWARATPSREKSL